MREVIIPKSNAYKLMNAEEEDLRTTENLLDYAWRAYGRQSDIFQKLDSKGTTLIGFAGAIIILSLTRLNLFTVESSALHWYSSVLLAAAKVFFTVFVLGFGLSFTNALRCLALREIKGPPASHNVVEQYRKIQKERQARRKLIRNVLQKSVVIALCEAETRLKEANDSKALKLKTSIIWLAISLFAGLGSFLLQVLFYTF